MNKTENIKQRLLKKFNEDPSVKERIMNEVKERIKRRVENMRKKSPTPPDNHLDL